MNLTQIILQSHLCHPDWSVQDNFDYIRFEEGWRFPDLEAAFGAIALPGERSPLDTITRILKEHAHA